MIHRALRLVVGAIIKIYCLGGDFVHRFISAVCAASITSALVVLSPTAIANAYSSCAEAIAAGVAPIYAGQPGYSKKLDRDGDGVACETGGGGSSSRSAYVPAASAPAQPYVPAPQQSAPLVVTPASGPGGAAISTVVTWTGTDCIDITAPNPAAAGVLNTGNYCGGTHTFSISPASGDAMVGADPVMGSAATMSCEIQARRLTDSGTAGDGHDINCLTRASAVS